MCHGERVRIRTQAVDGGSITELSAVVLAPYKQMKRYIGIIISKKENYLEKEINQNKLNLNTYM